MQPEWNVIGHVISSKYRLAVLRQLSDGASTPTQLASSMAVSTTHVSRALRQLGESDLVLLAVPNDQAKHRTYELTSRGESTWEAIRVNGLSE